MNTALPGHYAQEYIVSVDCTLVDSESCSLVKHIWCFHRTAPSRVQTKSYCGLKELKRLKRHNPKPVPTFGLECILHALVPCLSTDSPVILLAFPSIPDPMYSFAVFSLGYDLYLPPQTEVTWQGPSLGGCGRGTELNP